MADMYGAVRSNEFRVKNVDAFRAWFDKYIFGAEIEFWIDKLEGDGSGVVSFGSEEQYPNAYPRYRKWNTDDGLPENEEDDDWDMEEVSDLNVWANELREHLTDGEIFQVVAGGNEKMRYVAYSELLVAKDSDKPVWINVFTDDTRESLRKRMKAYENI